MTGLPFNSPEKESPESPYMLVFWPAFLNAATRAGFIGNEVGDDYFEFTHNNKTVTIKISVK